MYIGMHVFTMQLHNYVREFRLLYAYVRYNYLQRVTSKVKIWQLKLLEILQLCICSCFHRGPQPWQCGNCSNVPWWLYAAGEGITQSTSASRDDSSILLSHYCSTCLLYEWALQWTYLVYKCDCWADGLNVWSEFNRQSSGHSTDSVPHKPFHEEQCGRSLQQSYSSCQNRFGTWSCYRRILWLIDMTW